jgi:hypothetical protein
VAAEIIPGLPPTREITTAMQKEVYSATIGSTLAIAAKAKDSGIRANATVMPAKVSLLALEKSMPLKLSEFSFFLTLIFMLLALALIKSTNTPISIRVNFRILPKLSIK